MADPASVRRPRLRRYLCPAPGCSARFEKPVHLRRHQISHAATPTLRCSVCGACFGRLDSFQRHARRKHADAAAQPVPIARELAAPAAGSSSSPAMPPAQPQADLSGAGRAAASAAPTSLPVPPAQGNDAALAQRLPTLQPQADGLAPFATQSFEAMVEQLFADSLFSFDASSLGADPGGCVWHEAPLDPAGQLAGGSRGGQPQAQSAASAMPTGEPHDSASAPEHLGKQARDLVARGLICPPAPASFDSSRLVVTAMRRIANYYPVVPWRWMSHPGELAARRPMLYVALATLATLGSHVPEVKAYGAQLWQLVFRVVWSSCVFLTEQPARLKDIVATMSLANGYALTCGDPRIYLQAVCAAPTGAVMTREYVNLMRSGEAASTLRHIMAAHGMLDVAQLRSFLLQRAAKPAADSTCGANVWQAGAPVDSLLSDMWQSWLDAEEYHRSLVIAASTERRITVYIEDAERPRLCSTLLDTPLAHASALWQCDTAQDWAAALAARLARPQWAEQSSTTLRDVARLFFNATPPVESIRACGVERGDYFVLGSILEALASFVWTARGWVNDGGFAPWDAGRRSEQSAVDTAPPAVRAALDHFAAVYQALRADQASSPGALPSAVAAEEGAVKVYMHWHALQLFLDFDFEHCRSGIGFLARSGTTAAPRSFKHGELCGLTCHAGSWRCPFSSEAPRRRAAHHAAAILALFLRMARSNIVTYAMACDVCHAYAVLAILAVLPDALTVPPRQDPPSAVLELWEAHPMQRCADLRPELRAWLATQPKDDVAAVPMRLSLDGDDWLATLLQCHAALLAIEQGWSAGSKVLSRCRDVLELELAARASRAV
jgi:hypothetical protein